MNPAAQKQQWLFWQADPHQWGAGKVHLVEETDRQRTDRQRTLCGKALETVPGRYVTDPEANCGGCLNALRARKEREKRENEWRQRQLALRLEREEKDREWHEQFDEYLASEAWRRRRVLVMRRENGLCEACRERRADQVHHSTYKHLFNEPLFELHAICRQCHEKLTALDRAARGETP